MAPIRPKTDSRGLRSVIRFLSDTPRVPPPEGFVDRVMVRLREDSAPRKTAAMEGGCLGPLRQLGSVEAIDAQDCAFCFFSASIWYLLLGIWYGLQGFGTQAEAAFGSWVQLQPFFFSVSAMILIGLGVLILTDGGGSLTAVRSGILLFLVLGIGNGLFGHLAIGGGMTSLLGVSEFLIGSICIGVFLNTMVTLHQRQAAMADR